MQRLYFFWLCAITLLVVLTGCTQSNEEISTENAWVRTPLPSKTTTAAYVDLKNHTKEPITLISAESETIGTIEFHKSELKGGMRRMVKLDKLEIPANDTLKLEPAGLHLMLFSVQEVEYDQHVINFHDENDLTFQVIFQISDDAPE